jgi:hypothetical protein
LEQGESSDGGKLRKIPQHERQSIARNSTAQVMDVGCCGDSLLPLCLLLVRIIFQSRRES